MSPDPDTEPGHFGKEEPRPDAAGTASNAGSSDAVRSDDTARADEEEVGSGSVAAPPLEPPVDDGGDDHRHMGHLDEGHTHGPSDSQYFTIFWVLFALTALEVSTYFWESWFGEGDVVRRIGVGVLLVIMVIKFALIAGFFMHLRFDAALVRRVFVFGLLVAIVIYLVAMTSMNIWTDNGNPWFDAPSPPITTTTLPEAGA